MSYDQRQDPRLAGDVERFHARPTIQRQSVASHSWNVARILLAIYPAASRETVIRALFHDIGEIVAGDAPYPVKAEHEDLRKAMGQIERDAWLAMVIPWSLPAPQQLVPLQVAAVKLADMIEMWEFAMMELHLGNVFAARVRDNCEQWLREKLEELMGQGEPYAELANSAISYIDRRNSVWRQS